MRTITQWQCAWLRKRELRARGSESPELLIVGPLRKKLNHSAWRWISSMQFDIIVLPRVEDSTLGAFRVRIYLLKLVRIVLPECRWVLRVLLYVPLLLVVAKDYPFPVFWRVRDTPVFPALASDIDIVASARFQYPLRKRVSVPHSSILRLATHKLFEFPSERITGDIPTMPKSAKAKNLRSKTETN